MTRHPPPVLWLLLPSGVCAAPSVTAVAGGGYSLTEKLVLCFGPLLLLGRRRWPLLVFLVMLPALSSDTLSDKALFPGLIALYTVALASSRRRTSAACALLFFAFWARTSVLDAFGNDWPDAPLILLGAVGLAVAPVALGLLARARVTLSARLEDLSRAREREDLLLAQQVLSAERARLAREMHDTVAHQVSLISVRTAALQVTTTDPEVRETARALRLLAARTLDELRQMVGVLRASGGTLDTRAPQPLLADLPRLIADSGLDVDTVLDIRLDSATARLWTPTVQRAAYRTVQEALTNSRKHAPGARVAVHLHDSDRYLHVEVRNTPPDPAAATPDLPTGGHGLTGLRERAQLTGGTLTSHPTPEGGYHLHAVFPAAPPEAATPTVTPLTP